MAKINDVMLAEPYDFMEMEKWSSIIVQPKLDGIRCLAIVEDESVVLITREGSYIQTVPHIAEQLKYEMPNGVYDGELISSTMSFQETVSIVKRKSLHPSYGKINLHIFDIRNNLRQSDRLTMLDETFRIFRPMSISKVQYEVCGFNDFMDKANRFLEMGYEGAIFRDPDAYYIGGRCKGLLKWKPTRFDVYDIVDMTEEIDKNGYFKGRLGAIVCKDSCGKIFKVGSGFTDSQREYLWRNSPVGKKIVVKFQELTKRGVPRFPVAMKII